jgi:prenyltransferase beta subunit
MVDLYQTSCGRTGLSQMGRGQGVLHKIDPVYALPTSVVDDIMMENARLEREAAAQAAE